MTDEERHRLRETYDRMQEGYELANRERLRRLPEVDTAETLLCLLPAFRLAARLPMRKSSGLVEYYRKLAKVYGRHL